VVPGAIVATGEGACAGVPGIAVLSDTGGNMCACVLPRGGRHDKLVHFGLFPVNLHHPVWVQWAQHCGVLWGSPGRRLSIGTLSQNVSGTSLRNSARGMEMTSCHRALKGWAATQAMHMSDMHKLPSDDHNRSTFLQECGSYSPRSRAAACNPVTSDQTLSGYRRRG
jgi:hypothetical protein